ncbi:CbtA family protein [Vineibacter terrae]|uniref:CbtA family protein n=1 Tax=Vineibacter terrae TaxID=2586908 RepID=UPI002E32FE99|nr:CbtA family protein [Vineibacter terrae]HEX2886652.1 CbtA family protein [Vineibacter terrae]
MLFRRVIACALLVGLCAGLIHSAVQRLQVVPIIAAAEVFESALEASPPSHDHAAHDHGDGTWEPQAGFERTAWTVIANVLASIGFALLLVPALAAWDRTRRDGGGASIATGLLWGAAGWVCFHVWPALGLPPELPGEASAPLGARQAWWALAVACAAAGLSMLCLVRAPWRLGGLVLLALPFVIGAPHLDGAPFAAFNAEAAAQMAALKQRFLVATAIASAVHWLALGALSGAAVRRWLRPLLTYTSPRASGER